jgi:UDP-glucose 4-epimerase
MPTTITGKILEQVEKAVKNDDILSSTVILRPFSVVGSHPSGRLNYRPQNQEDSLFENIIKTIREDIPYFSVYGNDFVTHDGTAVRDFIHVVDVGRCFKAVLFKQMHGRFRGNHIFNVGTGLGISVK